MAVVQLRVAWAAGWHVARSRARPLHMGAANPATCASSTLTPTAPSTRFHAAGRPFSAVAHGALGVTSLPRVANATCGSSTDMHGCPRSCGLPAVPSLRADRAYAGANPAPGTFAGRGSVLVAPGGVRLLHTTGAGTYAGGGAASGDAAASDGDEGEDAAPVKKKKKKHTALKAEPLEEEQMNEKFVRVRVQGAGLGAVRRGVASWASAHLCSSCGYQAAFVVRRTCRTVRTRWCMRGSRLRWHTAGLLLGQLGCC